MSDCYVERVMQYLQAALQTAMDSQFGTGHQVIRDFPAVDPQLIDSIASPTVYFYEPSSRYADEDEHRTFKFKELLISGLVRCTDGFTSTMQGQANNLEGLVESTLFLEPFTIEDGLVRVVPTGTIQRQQGRNHIWVDIPVTIRIPRRDESTTPVPPWR